MSGADGVGLFDRILAESADGLKGLPSFCTANDLALDAIAKFAAAESLPILIEATSNQVNQDGGYTGLDPASFRRRELRRTAAAGLDSDRVLLGGDHLGPNPWRHLSAEAAMSKGEAMVAAYASAGFVKLHLDASMPLGGEPHPSPAVVAERAARLAGAAERSAGRPEALRYVIGTEVPTPGGEADGHGLEVTSPQSFAETVETHRAAFKAAGLEAAFARVRAVVVQPGVEFLTSDILHYAPEAARPLAAALAKERGLVFEAHSTDYQTDAALAALVRDGSAILKVGPELTFAFREAVVAFDAIEAVLYPAPKRAGAMTAVLAAMRAEPAHWRSHYRAGEPNALERMMVYSYADRIRYYWNAPGAADAVRRLFAHLPEGAIPRPLLSQFLPDLLPLSPADRPVPSARFLAEAKVAAVAARYYRACR